MIAIEIRPERAADVKAIRALVTTAFGQADDTANFVDAVRVEAEVCLAEVAVAGGAIVGHAQWCAAPLIVDGTRLKAAYLSCLSVEPEPGRPLARRLRSGEPSGRSDLLSTVRLFI
jgi:predicted N-acetyltransferase YhbS